MNLTFMITFKQIFNYILIKNIKMKNIIHYL